MEIKEVDAKSYDNYFKDHYNVFLSASFNNLNSDKCEKVFYLLFLDSKVRLGLILGGDGKDFFAPFSAPFGGFSYLNEDIKLQYIDESLILLKQWSLNQKVESIRITMPPTIYNSSVISKIQNSLYRNGFELLHFELNYSFELKNLDKDYRARLWSNAKKNLNIAFKNNLVFNIALNEDEKRQAFHIIEENRKSKGYSLSMNWEQIVKTANIIKIDFFLVNLPSGEAIASAIVFHVTKNIVQVIYWGDLSEFSNKRSMNFLSYKVFEFYKSMEIQIVDIGPGTLNSEPNFGLCTFKESLGSMITNKLTFRLSIS